MWTGRHAPSTFFRWILVSVSISFLGCASSSSFKLGDRGRVETFDAIVGRAPEILAGRYGMTVVRVHFAPGEQGVAARALALGLSCPQLLEARSGLRLRARVELYLWPASARTEGFSCETQGRADFIGVFLVPPGGDLLDVRYNRDWFREVYPHELAHRLLARYRLEDNWLREGLPEYLMAEFAAAYAPKAPDARTFPGVLALARLPLVPWHAAVPDLVLRYERSDPELAVYLGVSEWEKYAAAEALLTRWMNAAERAGIEEPLKDLLRRIGGRRIHFEEIEKLAVAQTGRSLRQLARLEDEDRQTLRQAAVENLSSADAQGRQQGLLLLAQLGPPAGFQPRDLFQVLGDAQHIREQEPGFFAEITWALARAVARLGRDEEMLRFEEEWRRLRPAERSSSFPPEYWERYAEIDRTRALAELVGTIGRDRASLAVRRSANAALERLTGASVGWRVDLPADERAARAARWKTVVGPP